MTDRRGNGEHHKDMALKMAAAFTADGDQTCCQNRQWKGSCQQAGRKKDVHENE